MKIIRVDMCNGSIKSSIPPKEWKDLGGRALISKIMEDEVDPVSEPLGKYNKLIIAPGILGGTTVSCVNRISIGAKSPLTGAIKESNAGGVTGYKLARLGIKAIILEGIQTTKDLKNLYISENVIELVDANDFKGLGIYETGKKLQTKYNEKIGMVIIGPAGERLYHNSGIANADKDGQPTRFSGRGGLGAVMGSKGLKSIIIDDTDAVGIDIKNEEQFKKTRSEISKAILDNKNIAGSYTKFGTANTVNLTNSMGALPTRNFSTGVFEGANNINGQKLYDLITERKGEGNTSHGCMPGCLIRCSNIFPDEAGKTIVSPLEYETIGLLGSNLGIDSLDVIGEMNYICNDLGLDTIEMGGAIGVAMEAGIISFGDSKGALELLNEIKEDSYLGRILSAGASITGKVLGIVRVPTAKGQSMPAYDPRAIKGLGVTYATSTQGADHTAGMTLRAPVDHTSSVGQVDASRNAQIGNTIHDSIGTCSFISSALNGDIQLLVDLYSGITGETYSKEDFINISKETLLRERKFNKGAGFNEAHDRIAEFFYNEENPITKTVFDVKKEDIDKLFDLY